MTNPAAAADWLLDAFDRHPDEARSAMWGDGRVAYTELMDPDELADWMAEERALGVSS